MSPMLGRKHSEDTKTKMSASRKGFKHSSETLAKMSATQKISQKTAINPHRFQKGESNPRFGKPRIAGSGTPAQVLEVFDKEKNKKLSI